MKKFKIVYTHGETEMTTENRTHHTGVQPSQRMVTGCLHTLMCDRKIPVDQMHLGLAKVYEDGVLNQVYDIHGPVKHKA